MNVDFTNTWEAITALAGAEFRTITGKSFTYKMVRPNALRPSRARQNLSRSTFERAFPLMPAIKGPGELNRLVRGPAYVWAILADDRIRSCPAQP